jgi:signal transduction histidine kinase
MISPIGSFLASLRFRLLLLIVLTLVPVLGVTMWNVSNQRTAITATVQSDALRLTKLIAANQTEQVESSRQLLTTVAQLPLILEEDLTTCDTLLADLLQQYPSYTNIYTLGIDGGSRCSGLPVEPGSLNVSDANWFQEVVATRTFVIGNYELGRLTRKPIVPLAMPVLDDENNVIGVVGAGLSLNWLNEFITQTPLPEGGVLTITDKNGVVLAVHPETGVEGVIGQSAAESPVFQEVAARGEGVTQGSGLSGIPRLFGFTQIGDPGTGIYIIVSVPESIAFAEVNTFQSSSLIALGLVSLLAAVTSLAGSYLLLMRPLNNLTNATRRLGEGDLSIRAKTYGITEFDSVADSFNRMASELGKRDALLATTNSQLEATNADLTREIEERKQMADDLKQFTVQLERSNQELEQFAYVASHDLQEPLRVVAGYLQLLERRYKGRLDQDADEFIAFAVDAAKRMQALINDLLAYSRVGRKMKPMEPTDCNQVVAQALKNLRMTIEEFGAVVEVGDLPTVAGDAGQLTLVFQNLIGNAIKFRGETPPVVRIQAKSCPKEWEFSVQDNGIGIDMQYSKRIFLIFQRLHTREEYPGTGIGLAICQKIIERHGGRVWLESQPGQGSTFFFTIPSEVQDSP